MCVCNRTGVGCVVLGYGDVCLVLARWAGQRPWGEGYALPTLTDWRGQLAGSAFMTVAA